MSLYCGIDIGGTKIKYGLVSDNGEVGSIGEIDTPTNQFDMVLTLNRIVKLFQEENHIMGVGISMPGVIYKGEILSTGALMFLDAKNFKNQIEDEVKLPINFVNDANAVALAELWKGNGSGCSTFICTTLGTAVGGGLVINGKLFEGFNGLAGEYGAGLRFNQGGNLLDISSAHCGVVAGACRKYSNLVNNPTKDFEYIINESLQGDADAEIVITDFCNHNATLLYNLALTLGPEKLLIGGGVSGNDNIIDRIRNEYERLANKYSPLKSENMPTIDVCLYRNSSGIVGSVYPFIRRSE